MSIAWIPTTLQASILLTLQRHAHTPSESTHTLVKSIKGRIFGTWSCPLLALCTTPDCRKHQRRQNAEVHQYGDQQCVSDDIARAVCDMRIMAYSEIGMLNSFKQAVCVTQSGIEQ